MRRQKEKIFFHDLDLVQIAGETKDRDFGEGWSGQSYGFLFEHLITNFKNSLRSKRERQQNNLREVEK